VERASLRLLRGLARRSSQLIAAGRRFGRYLERRLPFRDHFHGLKGMPIPFVRPVQVMTENRIISMNSSSEDKIKGTAKEAVGKVKEETGKAIGNPNLRDRGTAEKMEGKMERKVGDVKKVFGK